MSSFHNASIVIQASNHNPTIITKEWLDNKQIISADEVKEFASTSVFSMIETADLVLTVDPGRLQFQTKTANEETIKKLPKLTRKYVESLMEVPYKAIGFNYQYKVGNYQTAHLIVTQPKFDALFEHEPIIGMIVKNPFDCFSARVTITPVDDTGANVNFNFNRNVKEASELLEALDEYQQARAEAERIVEGLASDD